jgi:hypothetical protein
MEIFYFQLLTDIKLDEDAFLVSETYIAFINLLHERSAMQPRTNSSLSQEYLITHKNTPILVCAEVAYCESVRKIQQGRIVIDAGY